MFLSQNIFYFYGRIKTCVFKIKANRIKTRAAWSTKLVSYIKIPWKIQSKTKPFPKKFRAAQWIVAYG
ncbi:MAG: hypothetical protein A3A81_05990 [Omnitrophica bacterium RIFCSPLOWO2_01_FULL_45_10b]|nr:MAG: hypothetical protein A3A81_05990 [Omnitrophica bacterium RIFCSPLOWO2_01_FULL_45_10b]